jgi:hypothetical protein
VYPKNQDATSSLRDGDGERLAVVGGSPGALATCSTPAASTMAGRTWTLRWR